jgi:hypothetical protein
VRRQHDRFQLRLLLLEAGQQVDAVHPRQVQVEQGDVEAGGRGLLEGLLGAARGRHLVPLPREAVHQGLAQLPVVIDDQETHRRLGFVGHGNLSG